MLTISVELAMESYIAHPYWPETNQVIQIQKCSGINRARSDDGRDKALKGYLKKIELTLAEYEALIAKSKRQWYRIDSDNPESPIVIPRHHFSAALVETVARSPASIRGKYKVDNFRTHVKTFDLKTDRTKADRVFQRYVKLETSNQRNFQSNEVIEGFAAMGRMEVRDDTKVEDLRRLVEYALAEVGVGASRKMAYGRGEVVTLALS